MRFISRYANYSHGVREAVIEPLATGVRVLQKELEAKFSTRGVKPFERELGVKNLSHHGTVEDRIEGGVMAPTSRISVFDSEEARKLYKWSDEEHDLVVETLRESPMLGVEFFESVEPKRPEPWRGYDRLEDVGRIIAAVEATGVDPAEVIKYEHENADREEVVAALEALLPEGAEEPVVIDAT